MHEFVVVDRPAVSPFACVATGETAGQMVDTHREVRGLGRVYLSKSAVIRAAKAFGLVKGGRRHEEILAALESLEHREQEIRALEARVSELDERLKMESSLLAEAREHEAWAEARIAQLVGALRDDANAKLALIGG
jgi:hypothetical protein